MKGAGRCSINERVMFMGGKTAKASVRSLLSPSQSLTSLRPVPVYCVLFSYVFSLPGSYLMLNNLANRIHHF